MRPTRNRTYGRCGRSARHVSLLSEIRQRGPLQAEGRSGFLQGKNQVFTGGANLVGVELRQTVDVQLGLELSDPGARRFGQRWVARAELRGEYETVGGIDAVRVVAHVIQRCSAET